ncbi:MAG: hypothetical protein QXJ68_09020 [Methanocellales archaeon]
MKQKLASLRDKIVVAKYHIDLGYSLMGYINFILLVITASSHILPFLEKFGLKFDVIQLVIIAIPSMFILVWLLGVILDRVVKLPQTSAKEGELRSPFVSEVRAFIARTDERLARMEREMRKE